MIEPTWITAFVDLPPDTHPAGEEYWAAVTGYGVSPARGQHGEFSTLEPPRGGSPLRVQRLGSGGPGIHPDLHVADPRAAALEAERLGATSLREDDGLMVLRSPGGLPFCLVDDQLSESPPPADWADGARSQVDQICVDIPRDAYQRETAFWTALSGWGAWRSPNPAFDEYTRLRTPAHLPLFWLLQRLDDPAGTVRAHLDLSSTDRAAEAQRHVRLGGRVVDVRERWTVLTDPAGLAYCITDRIPGERPRGG